MKEDIDYEDVYVHSDYATAFQFLLGQSIDDLKAGLTPEITLVRFYIKASRLRRLEESDRRIDRKSRKGIADEEKEETDY